MSIVHQNVFSTQIACFPNIVNNKDSSNISWYLSKIVNPSSNGAVQLKLRKVHLQNGIANLHVVNMTVRHLSPILLKKKTPTKQKKNPHKFEISGFILCSTLPVCSPLFRIFRWISFTLLSKCDYNRCVRHFFKLMKSCIRFLHWLTAFSWTQSSAFCWTTISCIHFWVPSLFSLMRTVH